MRLFFCDLHLRNPPGLPCLTLAHTVVRNQPTAGNLPMPLRFTSRLLDHLSHTSYRPTLLKQVRQGAYLFEGDWSGETTHG